MTQDHHLRRFHVPVTLLIACGLAGCGLGGPQIPEGATLVAVIDGVSAQDIDARSGVAALVGQVVETDGSEADRWVVHQFVSADGNSQQAASGEGVARAIRLSPDGRQALVSYVLTGGSGLRLADRPHTSTYRLDTPTWELEIDAPGESTGWESIDEAWCPQGGSWLALDLPANSYVVHTDEAESLLASIPVDDAPVARVWLDETNSSAYAVGAHGGIYHVSEQAAQLTCRAPVGKQVTAGGVGAIGRTVFILSGSRLYRANVGDGEIAEKSAERLFSELRLQAAYGVRALTEDELLLVEGPKPEFLSGMGDTFLLVRVRFSDMSWSVLAVISGGMPAVAVDDGVVWIAWRRANKGDSVVVTLPLRAAE